MDELTKRKDNIVNFRNDMEHYSNEYERLVEGKGLQEHETLYKKCVTNINSTIRDIGSVKDLVVDILDNIERCEQLTATQGLTSMALKFKEFKEPVGECIKVLGFMKSDIASVQSEFFNLTPVANLQYNMFDVISALRTVGAILYNKVDVYINKDNTNFEYLEELEK